MGLSEKNDRSLELPREERFADSNQPIHDPKETFPEITIRDRGMTEFHVAIPPIRFSDLDQVRK